LTVGIAAVVALSVVAMNLLADRSNDDAWLAWAAFIVIAVLWMVRISRQRTNGEWCWRWGQRRDEGI